jgi:hypothetical protein
MSVTFKVVHPTATEVLDMELNFSNTNAAAILFSLNRFEDADNLQGTWTEVEIDQLIKRTIVLLNTKGGINSLIKQDYQQANFYEKGRDEEYVVRRLKDLLTLFLLAKQQKASIDFF